MLLAKWRQRASLVLGATPGTLSQTFSLPDQLGRAFGSGFFFEHGHTPVTGCHQDLVSGGSTFLKTLTLGIFNSIRYPLPNQQLLAREA